jgi:hypothetical protein
MRCVDLCPNLFFHWERARVTNLLEQASQWLSGQIDAHASNSVLYRRGSLTVPLVAGKARSTYELVDSNGMIVNVEVHDFLITAESLVLDGMKCTPEVGDQLIETVEGELHSYEVMIFGTEKQYRFCDPYHHKLRVHTKYMGVVHSL